MSRLHPDQDLLRSRKTEVLERLDDILGSLSHIKSNINRTKEVAENIESEKPRQKFYVDTEKYLTEVDTVHIPGSSNSFDQVLKTLSDLRYQIQKLQENVARIGTETRRQRFYDDPFHSNLEIVDVDPPTERRPL